ncbi:MAG TPA: insulinase family protein, partial [Bdellovibrionales bacterium]|nr:insulinase family protein [Bdellovibrionales bacterium]
MMRALLLTLLLLPGLAAGMDSKPEIKIEKINGFEVHFVNLKNGNSFTASFMIPTGTLHESTRFLGRAHLIEHLLFTGTPEFPGHHTYQKLLGPAGALWNANTGIDRTFYYASTTEEHAELALKTQFTMLGGLEWQPQAIENERGVVMKEVKEYNLRDSFAHGAMVFSELPVEGHPLRHPYLGGGASLASITMDELKDFYHHEYRPENVRVAIHGNFSDPMFFERVRGWTKEYLHSFMERENPPALRPVERNLAHARIPSLFSADLRESRTRLTVKSDGMRSFEVLMEADPAHGPLDNDALMWLSRYMSDDSEGTLGHELRAKGWVTDYSTGFMPLNNTAYLTLSAHLTAEGEPHTDEIIEAFYRHLRSIQQNGIDQLTLSLWQNHSLFEADLAVRNGNGFARYYVKTLQQKLPHEDFVNARAKVSVEQIAKVARAFSPERALYAVATPDLQSNRIAKDFERPYRLESNEDSLKRFVQIMETESTGQLHVPKWKKLELEVMPEGQFKTYLLQSSTADGSVTRAFDFRENLFGNSILIDFISGSRDPADLVAARILVSAFTERYLGELTYLYFKHRIGFGFHADDENYRSSNSAAALTLSATGEDASVVSAMSWMLDKLREFKPTGEEWDRARTKFKDGIEIEYSNKFAAQIVSPAMVEKIDPLRASDMTARELAKGMDAETAIKNWERLLARADLRLIASGQLTREGLLALEKGAVKRFAPNARTPGQRAWARTRPSAFAPGTEWTEKFPAAKGSPNTYAVVRYYQGPLYRDYR